MTTPAFQDTKDPAEAITVTFDVNQLLLHDETITGTPVVTATAITGQDPSPADIISGAAIVSGKRIFQRIVGGVNHERYLLRCTLNTSDARTYAVAARLLVKTITP
jgi:hypothetical protein